MTFSDIVNLVTARIGKTDDYARARALESCQLRDKFIYDSYDWNAAQSIVSQTVSTSPFVVSGATKITSAKFDGNFIDHVSPSFVFESHADLLEGYGTPIYYWQHLANPNDAVVTINLIPNVDPNGPIAGKSIVFLVKEAYNPSLGSTTIPDTENALIAFVMADMWEFLRQFTKYQAKLEEAKALLSDAQAKDSPGIPKPRTSKSLSVNGSTLAEMVDSTCDIIGRWEPELIESVKDRIRRNYDLLWNMQLWPETIIIADAVVSRNQQNVILPHLFDKVIGVRTNQGGPLTRVTPLKNANLPYYLDVAFNIFEQSGEPIFYNLLPSIAIQMLPDQAEYIIVEALTQHSDVGAKIFVKGETGGEEFQETLELNSATFPYATSVNRYETITTLSKPVTDAYVFARTVSDSTPLVLLRPEEIQRKHIRLEIHPNFSADGISADAGSVLVCGKRVLSPLVNDHDAPALRNVASILINSAAADMFDKLGQGDMAAKYTQKAQALTQVLIKGETEQSTNIVKITPYTESFSSRSRISSTFP